MIKIYDDNNEFVAKFEDFFKSDEIKFGLIWRIAMRSNIVTYMVSSIIEDHFVLGVLAGKNLILASNTTKIDVYQELVAHMDTVDYPGIIGEKQCCFTYKEVFEQHTNQLMKVEMDQRIYSCKEVIDHADTRGSVRLAVEKDLELLTQWSVKFALEAEGYVQDTNKQREHVLSKIKTKLLYVLEIDNEVVSMTARTNTPGDTESVGYVYTPKEYRGRGYASLLVAEVTKHVLNDGKIATLYTDLSNPTSNSIYMKIGYEPYCDSVMIVK